MLKSIGRAIASGLAVFIYFLCIPLLKSALMLSTLIYPGRFISRAIEPFIPRNWIYGTPEADFNSPDSEIGFALMCGMLFWWLFVFMVWQVLGHRAAKPNKSLKPTR